MVTFDNHYMSSSKAIELVKSLMKKSLNGYILKSEYDKTIYWQIVYEKGGIEIMFGSGRGFLEYSIIKDKADIDISKYEQNLQNTVIASSEKNIRFVFDVMKDILEKIDKGDLEK